MDVREYVTYKNGILRIDILGMAESMPKQRPVSGNYGSVVVHKDMHTFVEEELEVISYFDTYERGHTIAELYTMYEDWCKSRGIENIYLRPDELARVLKKQRGVKSRRFTRLGKRVRLWPLASKQEAQS